MVGSTLDINSSTFTVGGGSFGALDLNQNNGTYVAYLFAHNDGDGDFGPTGDQDIIKCGSFTKTDTGFSNFIEVDLGWEAQWVLVKKTNEADGWEIWDTMRGFHLSGGKLLEANTSSSESNYSDALVYPTANGFAYRDNNDSSNIYIAIRRGPMAVPESATDVFAIQAQAGGYTVNRFASSGFPVDFVLDKEYDDPSNWLVYDRLRGGKADLKTNSTAAEATNSPAPIGFDYNDGITEGFYNSANNVILPMWKRAPSFCDVVAYTGNGTARTINHNLGAVPEMIWIKKRANTDGSGTGQWCVYHSGLGGGKVIQFNTFASYSTSDYFPSTQSSSDTFSIGTQHQVNGNGSPMIAYLFASLDGISKVGSATHSGTTNVDCGFTSGARFVLLKRTDASGDWYIWDSTRGIVSGNDPYLLLNTTAAEVTNTDLIDPLSSGFTITSNFTAGDYIFYAIA